MQRLFSMFPQGGPGIALLLLRTSVAAILLHAVLCLGRRPGPFLSVVVGLAAVFSFALIIGFLTPLLSSLTCLADIACVFCGPSMENLALVPGVLVAAALALLGPGAYSLDARLYGRRVTVVQARRGPNPPAATPSTEGE